MNKGRRKGVQAWLVTWEWAGEHAKRDDKIVAVFNPHLGGVRVRELVEFLYMTHSYSTGERIIALNSLCPASPFRTEKKGTEKRVLCAEAIRRILQNAVSAPAS